MRPARERLLIGFRSRELDDTPTLLSEARRSAGFTPARQRRGSIHAGSCPATDARQALNVSILSFVCAVTNELSGPFRRAPCPPFTDSLRNTQIRACATNQHEVSLDPHSLIRMGHEVVTTAAARTSTSSCLLSTA